MVCARHSRTLHPQCSVPPTSSSQEGNITVKPSAEGAWERQGPGPSKKSLCLPGEPAPPPPVLQNFLTSPRPHRCEERPRWLLERHHPRSSARPCLWKQSHHPLFPEGGGPGPGQALAGTQWASTDPTGGANTIQAWRTDGELGTDDPRNSNHLCLQS